jgi:hypothetical protein
MNQRLAAFSMIASAHHLRSIFFEGALNLDFAAAGFAS